MIVFFTKLCIKVVKKDSHYIRMHGQQNVIILRVNLELMKVLAVVFQ